MIFADRFVAYDHELGDAWMVCLVEPGKEADARATGSKRSSAGSRRAVSRPARAPGAAGAGGRDRAWVMRHDRDAYLDRIRAAWRRSPTARRTRSASPTTSDAGAAEGPAGATYRLLRSINPAPYAAFLRFRRSQRAELPRPSASCASRRRAWSSRKPIKGTAPRGATSRRGRRDKEQLRTSEKDRPRT